MIITDKICDFIGSGLIKAGAGDVDHDAFIMLVNTPMGQQPAVTLMLQMKNPLLGQPPLTVATVTPLAEVREDSVHDAVAQMVGHLSKQKTELLAQQQ